MCSIYGSHDVVSLMFQFIERFYQLMDNDNSGRITIQEILDAFGKLTWLVTEYSCC